MSKDYYKTMREELAATVEFFETLVELHPEIVVFQQCSEKAKDELLECVEDVTDIMRDVAEDFNIFD